jgi:hypothetical protein
MYLVLHNSVCRLLKEDDLSFTFFAIDKDKGFIKEYNTNIIERFKCLNKFCFNKG